MRGNFWAIPVPAFPALKKAPSSCWKQPLKYNWWFRRVNAEFRTLRKWASSPQIAAWSCHTINQQHPAIISWYQQISHRFRSFNPSNWLARLFKNTLALNNSIFQCPEIKIYPETARLKWITIDFCLWKNASVLFGWNHQAKSLVELVCFLVGNFVRWILENGFWNNVPNVIVLGNFRRLPYKPGSPGFWAEKIQISSW